MGRGVSGLGGVGVRGGGADGLTVGDLALTTGCGGGRSYLTTGLSGLISLLEGGLGLGSLGGDGGLSFTNVCSLDFTDSAISVGDLGVKVTVDASSSSC